MSKYRNRNIRNKFGTGGSATERADSGVDTKSYFGEAVSSHWRFPTRGPSSLSSEETVDIVDDDEDYRAANNSSFDKSSTSSLSWADGCEAQATESVRKEFETMERVLQCLEPIPSHYDKDEYKLWIRTFPCLSLTGQSRSHVSATSVRKDDTKVNNCDSSTSKSKQNHNATVIDKLLEELYPPRKQHHNTTTYSQKETAVNNTLNPRTLNVNFESFLQISPALLNVPSSRKSSRTQHWIEALENDEHKSLPYLPSACERPNKQYSDSHKNSESTLLPPIKKDDALSRSISARSERPVTRRSLVDNFYKNTVLEMEEFERVPEDFISTEHAQFSRNIFKLTKF